MDAPTSNFFAQPNGDPMLQFFKYDHLPANLQMISKPFCDLAHAIVLGDNQPHSVTGTVTIGSGLPRNPERTVALRKLLEAKDCAVRALLYTTEPQVAPGASATTAHHSV